MRIPSEKEKIALAAKSPAPIAKPGDEPALQLKRATLLTLCREPSAVELKTLSDCVSAEPARFAAAPAKAAAFNKAAYLPAPPAEIKAERRAALTAACVLLGIEA